MTSTTKAFFTKYRKHICGAVSPFVGFAGEIAGLAAAISAGDGRTAVATAFGTVSALMLGSSFALGSYALREEIKEPITPSPPSPPTLHVYERGAAIGREVMILKPVRSNQRIVSRRPRSGSPKVA